MRFMLIDVLDGTIIDKGLSMTELKGRARDWHYETDGECMLSYIPAKNGKYNLDDRKPVYTSWDDNKVVVTVVK